VYDNGLVFIEEGGWFEFSSREKLSGKEFSAFLSSALGS
jgi:hypothetical protein